MTVRVAVIGVKGLPGYGGSARANNAILPLLAHKYHLTVYAMDTHADEKVYKGVNQHIFRCGGPGKWSTLTYYLKSVFHALFFGNYDIIHLNHGSSGFITLALRTRYPVITTIRGLNKPFDNKWNWLEYRVLRLSELLSFKFSSRLTTVEKSSVPYIRNRTNKPVTFIPNGVYDLYSTFATVGKQNVLTFSAARIVSLKGLHDLLRALHLINFRDKVRIIGDLTQVPSYEDEIISLARGLDVEFTGLIQEQNALFRLIASSRLFVFPSHSEGMSNMLMETASLNVPIIASDIKANADIFDSNEVIYFPVGNVEQLADKIDYYWNNPVRAEKMAARAYQKVKSSFHWEQIAKEYDLIYQKMLRRKIEQKMII